MNMPATDIQEYTLSLEREFNAPAARVFKAWTDPDVLMKWFVPEGVVCESAHVDLRGGDTYRLARGIRARRDPQMENRWTWFLHDLCTDSAPFHRRIGATVEICMQPSGSRP